MPVYELMRKDQRVTVLAVNKTGGIEKCDYKNINQEIAPLQERICSDWIERWWNMDLCQYFEHKKLKGYADFFNSSSSFCCGVI